jgi:hypothetical protein
MDREARNAVLELVVKTIRDERGTPWSEMTPLRLECEGALSRTLFDRDAALAILRGDELEDDDPWDRCPYCDCDTYFRSSVGMTARDEEGTEIALPLTTFVCEACHHTEFRARANVERGMWWTEGTRIRAQPLEAGHPYRGDDVVVDDADDDDEADEEADELATDTVWIERRTCSDGACIGLLDADDRCKVCGRA